MRDKGFTQAELTARAQAHMPPGKKITPDSISSYIRGLKLPRPERLHALAKALGVSPESLLEEDQLHTRRPPPHRGSGSRPYPHEERSRVSMVEVGNGKVALYLERELSLKTALDIMNLIEKERDGQ
jgi:transcriptional regulator with XRE-family HTH domain